VILVSENSEDFTEMGEESMGQHKIKHTKGKMKRNPCQRLQTSAGILNLPWSGERNENEVITSVICSVWALKYNLINSMQDFVMPLKFNPRSASAERSHKRKSEPKAN
jgi:hypothetical protein